MDSNTECKSENEPINKKLKLLENKDSTDEDDDNDSIGSIEDNIPVEGFNYPLEHDASDMLDGIHFNGHFPSVTERYFTPYYQIDVQKPGDDICIRIHSNRICMISLAPSHTIFQQNKTITGCNFKVSEKLDRIQNKVSGKSKHGAQPLQSNSNLCILSCNDGSTYTVKCCMIGKLIEVNERLVNNPELLKKEPHFGGYVAIVLPNLKHLEQTRDKMLTQELYEEAIKKRIENGVKQEIVSDMEITIKNGDINAAQLMDTENKIKKKMVKDEIIDMEVIEKEEQSKDHINAMEIMNS